MKRRFKLISTICAAAATAFVVMCGLQGCTTFGNNVAAEKLVVQYATMKVVESDKDSTAERAAKINEIATAAQSFFDSDTATVALLRAEVQKRLPPDLSPADKMLAGALIDTVVTELQARVGEGLVPEEKRYQVSVVLGWIREATGFYGV